MSNIFDQLVQDYRYGSDVQEILRSLTNLQDLQAQGELERKERIELQVYAFQTLQELTVGEPNTAQQIILKYLLPECAAHDQDAGIWLRRHRECLSQWLEQLPEDQRYSLTLEILETLYPKLNLPEPQGICWTLSQIGYRNDEIVESLWAIAHKNVGEVGDVALGTIISLGVLSKDREIIRTELHSRVADHFNFSLVSSLARFADPASLRAIIDHWLTSEDDAMQSIDTALALAAVRDILDGNNQDSSLQDWTWNELTSLAARNSDEFSDTIHQQNLASSCNSSLVVASLFERIAYDIDRKENPSFWQYRAASTLENCVRPNQLEGWASLPKDSPAWEKFCQAACQNTGSNSRWATMEESEKLAAWGMVLRAGHMESLDWFDDAILSESSLYVQQHIMELLACFKTEPLPRIVQDWITEQYDDPLIGGEGGELGRRMAAAQMARSAATYEAFETLLNSGYTVKGKGLKQSSDALIEVATHLVSKGNKKIEGKLIDTIIARDSAHQSEAAAFALEYVVQSDGSTLLQQIPLILPLLSDTEREEYERGTLLSALGQLPNWKIPDELMTLIEDWAVQPNRWLGGSSLALLAHRGVLHRRPELLRASLGLTQIDDKWDLPWQQEPGNWTPYFIGLLFQEHPESYMPAVISLLENSTWYPIQIMAWLQEIYGPRQQVLPSKIAEAIILRIKARQSPTYSEPEIFKILVQLAPEALANEDWNTVWDGWHHSARVGLADALGNLDTQSNHRTRVIEQLRQLSLDSQYAVRRSAYRGLAHQSLFGLYTDCLAWATPQNPIELRQRAAEAFGWLNASNDQISLVNWEGLYETLYTDPEKDVRETLSRSMKERRQRLWASQYLPIVMDVMNGTNEDIMDTWRYGEALAQIGDDSCIEALKDHLQKDLPLHIRHWINRLIKAMEKSWRKATEKWPDPWYPWDGSIEQGQGNAITSTDEAIQIEYTLWFQRAARPRDLSSWGGAIWSVPFGQANDIQAVELENGARGTILVHEVSNERIIFLGRGPYPNN